MSSYVSVDELKEYLGISKIDAALDTFLQKNIDRAQAVIESKTQRKFQSDTPETRLFDAYNDVGDNGRTLFLDHDLCVVTEIINGDGTLVDANDYYFWPLNQTPHSEIILTKISGLRWQIGNGEENAISVTGHWAYSMTPPADIIQATIRLASYLYRQRDNAQDLERTIVIGGQVLLPQQLPADVQSIVTTYLALS